MAEQIIAPTAEETWQHIRSWYYRASRHVITESPDYPDYLHKEVIVVEAPRRNMKTVRIEIDGTRKGRPIMWLRPIIIEEVRAEMRKTRPR